MTTDDGRKKAIAKADLELHSIGTNNSDINRASKRCVWMITEYGVMKKETNFKINDLIVGNYHQFCDEMHYYSIIVSR